MTDNMHKSQHTQLWHANEGWGECNKTWNWISVPQLTDISNIWAESVLLVYTEVLMTIKLINFAPQTVIHLVTFYNMWYENITCQCTLCSLTSNNKALVSITSFYSYCNIFENRVRTKFPKEKLPHILMGSYVPLHTLITGQMKKKEYVW